MLYIFLKILRGKFLETNKGLTCIGEFGQKCFCLIYDLKKSNTLITARGQMTPFSKNRYRLSVIQGIFTESNKTSYFSKK